MKIIYKILIFFSICLCGTVSITAQNVTVNNDLSFGNVFPGIPKHITKYTAGFAAEFIITGVAGDEVTIDIDPPRYMNYGGFHMQMIFNETDCALDTAATPDQSSPEFDDLDPWSILTYRLGSSGIVLWLGGTVVPGLTQIEGNYAASIVITVSYTGN